MKQFTLVAMLIVFSSPALAYVGPGLGIGVIGTIFGILAAIVLAVFGLFWYPMKRALRKKKEGAKDHRASSTVGDIEQTDHPDISVSMQHETPKANATGYKTNRSSMFEEASTPTTTKTRQTDSQAG